MKCGKLQMSPETEKRSIVPNSHLGTWTNLGIADTNKIQSRNPISLNVISVPLSWLLNPNCFSKVGICDPIYYFVNYSNINFIQWSIDSK
jgi:hypothetical protein